MEIVHDWELVGRGPLINEVDRRLNEAGCNGVVLTGFPGVGKRRIMAEVRRRWEHRGGRCVSLVAVSGTSTIPFAALAPVLSPDEVASPNRDEVSDLELHQLARAALSGTPDDPVLVDVVDISQLDVRSAAVIGQLMIEQRVRLLGSERSTGDPSGVMERFAGERVVEVPVPTLDDDSMAELVDVALAHPSTPDLRQRLVALSGGIAFNLGEILEQSIVDGAIELRDGRYEATASLPRSARLNRILTQQLDRLTDDERAVIDVLAIAGRLDADSLVALSSDGAVDSLDRRGIVQVSARGNDLGVTLTRPLTADVAIENMSSLRARSLRLAIAEQLEAIAPRRGDERGRALELRLDAGADAAPDLLLVEARRALDHGDYRRAERFASAAERVSGRADFATRQILAEVMSKWARFEDADRLIAGAEVTGDEERMIRRVLRSDYLYWGVDLDVEAVAERIDPDEERVSPALEAVGNALTETRRIVSGHPQARVELERIADAVDDPSGRVRAHRMYGMSVAAAMMGRADEARELAVAGMDEGLGDPSSVLDRHPAEFWLLHAYADMVGGEFDRSRSLYQRGYDQCADIGAAAAMAWYASGLVRMGPLDGQLEQAVVFGARMSRIGADLAIPAARQIGRAGQAVALAMLGNVEDAQAALDDAPVTSKIVYRFDLDRARAWLHVARGETAHAADALEEAALMAESVELVHNATLARLDLVRLGRGVAQADPLADLARGAQGVFIAAVSDAAAAIAGDDVDELLRCVDRFDSMGATLIAAEMAALASDALRGSQESRRSAAAEQRSLGLRARVDPARTPAFGRLSGQERLTDREREVAELAARGRKNADIAVELFLSVRTVENHLQRTYRKLGVAGRDDLAGALGLSG